MRFRNRRHAGILLAEKLVSFRAHPDTVVLGLPRGGVPVAEEVARALGLPLDVCVVRKLGAPGQPEFAIGAIATGGVEIWDNETVDQLRVTDTERRLILQKQRSELERREVLFRRGRAPLDVQGKWVLLVDDGVATGATMKAAVQALKKMGAFRIVVAVPVSSRAAFESLSSQADDMVCLSTPESFFAVGQYYDDFTQVEEDEVSRILDSFSAGSQPSTCA